MRRRITIIIQNCTENIEKDIDMIIVTLMLTITMIVMYERS